MLVGESKANQYKFLVSIFETCFKSLKMFILFNQVILFPEIFPEEIIFYLQKKLIQKDLLLSVIYNIKDNTNVQHYKIG